MTRQSEIAAGYLLLVLAVACMASYQPSQAQEQSCPELDASSQPPGFLEMLEFLGEFSDDDGQWQSLEQAGHRGARLAGRNAQLVPGSASEIEGAIEAGSAADRTVPRHL